MAEKGTERKDNIEDLVYETRFLLNVLIDLLVEKKLITEKEVYDRFDQELTKAEKELESSGS